LAAMMGSQELFSLKLQELVRVLNRGKYVSYTIIFV